MIKSLVRQEPGPGGRTALRDARDGARVRGLERLVESDRGGPTMRRAGGLGRWRWRGSRCRGCGGSASGSGWTSRGGAHANLRAALGWLAEAGEREEGACLAAALWDLWLYGGHPGEGRAWLDRSW